jgi:hypothetical protein
MMEERRQWFLPALVFLSVVAIAGLVWANYVFSLRNPGGNDFLARWMGARFWLKQGISPYDPRVSRATQEMIYGHLADPNAGEDIGHFVYPLTSMLFFGPFGLLDYLTARTLWMTLLEVSLIALAVMSLKLAEWRVSIVKAAALLLFAVLWYHGVRAVIVGQFAALDAVLMTGSLLLIMGGQDTGAGFLLALSTAKPQMVFLLVPFVLLWAFSARRRQIIGSFFATLGLLLFVSILLLPQWPLQMLWQVLEYPGYTNIGSPLSIIASTAPGINAPLNWALHGVSLLYLFFEWIRTWGKDEHQFLWTALLTIVVTNIVAFRTATTNYVVLLPVLFLIFKVFEDRWGRIGQITTWFWLFVLFFGLWLLFMRTVQGNVENAIMYLPLPVYCLLGLWWVRWWLIKPPLLQLERLGQELR